MSVWKKTLNATFVIEALFLRGDGTAETNPNAIVFLFRDSDDFYWNGATFTNTTRVSNAMTKKGDVTHPGWSTFSFPTVGLTADIYYLEVHATTGTSINNRQNGTLITGGTDDDAAIARMALTNKLELADGSVGNFVLHNDEGGVFLTFNVTDKDGNSIVVPIKNAAKRAKGT